MTDSEEPELEKCRGPFHAALKRFVLFATVWVLLTAVPTRNSFLFLAMMAVTWGGVYYGWLTLWYGVPLVVLAVPPHLRTGVQGAIALPESDEPSKTSPDERAYLHYVVYSTFAVGGVLIALTEPLERGWTRRRPW